MCIRDRLSIALRGKNTKLTIGVFYRSASCNVDNDLKLFDLLKSLCTTKVVNLLCLGDFDWPNIDCSTWTSASRSRSELGLKFIDTLRKKLLSAMSLPICVIMKIGWCALKLYYATSVSFFETQCTDKREMCASCSICLTERWLCWQSSWLCTNRLNVFSIMHWPWSSTTGMVLTQPNLSIFFQQVI